MIALDPDKSVEVAGAVKTLLEQNRPVEPTAPAPASFDAAMQRFRAASDALRWFDEELDRGRARAAAKKLSKLLAAATGWGVEIRTE